MLALFGGLFLLLVCIDMGVKQYIEDTFENREERETVIDKVVLRKVYNRGFFMNTLEKRPEVIKSSSIVIGIGIMIYNICLFPEKGRWLHKLGMVLISAGAVSNIFDRLVRGKVIDYIGLKSKYKRLSVITANLADLYIVIGAVITGLSKGIRK